MFLHIEDSVVHEGKKNFLYEHLEKNGVLVVSKPLWNFSEKKNEEIRSFVFKKYGKQRFHLFPPSLKLLLLQYSSQITSFLNSFFSECNYKLQKLDLSIIHTQNNEPLQIEFTRRSHGDRILSVCSVLNYEVQSSWSFAEDFCSLAKNALKNPSLISNSFGFLFNSHLHSICHRLGLPLRSRSFYDLVMKRIAKGISQDPDFQKQAKKKQKKITKTSTYLFFSDGSAFSFPPSSLVVQQRFLVSRFSLLNPEYSPASILERVTGKMMVSPIVCNFK
jgi:hypothetical protein